MAETPACPRCGYDQQGVIDSWKTECPLAGICSECGLEFRWCRLLDPRFMNRPGLYEHATRHHFLHFLYTLWRALRPWSFWRWVRIEDRIDSGRVLTTAIVGLIPVGLLMVAILSIFASLLAWIVSTRLDWADFEPLEWVKAALTLGGGDYYYFMDSPYGMQLAPFMLVLAVAPAGLLIFGDSMRMAQTRRVHLLRVWGYTTLLLPMFYGLMGLTCVTTLAMWGLSGIGRVGTSTAQMSLFERTTLFLVVGWPLVGCALCMLAFAWVMRLATARYLRLRSAWFVTISITLITTLVAAVGMVLLAIFLTSASM